MKRVLEPLHEQKFKKKTKMKKTKKKKLKKKMKLKGGKLLK